MTQLKRFVFMDLKLRVLGTLLVVAASGCVETPVDKNSANSNKFDEGSQTGCVMEMIPDRQTRTYALKTAYGATVVRGGMKPVGKSDWVDFNIGLMPEVPPVPGVYLLGKMADVHLGVGRSAASNKIRAFDLDLTATQGTVEFTRIETHAGGRVQGVLKNAVLVEGRQSRDPNDPCPSILVPELQFDATWR